MKTCPQCGVESRWKFCSKRCESAHGRAHEARICKLDGCDNPLRARGLCSTHYNQITNHLTDPIRNGDPERKRVADLMHHKRRRALLHGVKAERINRDDIAERDGWRCGICLKVIDRAAKWPDLMCASLDHVVPLAELGEHTAANVRIAHFRCNVSRGARGGGEQLRLIG